MLPADVPKPEALRITRACGKSTVVLLRPPAGPCMPLVSVHRTQNSPTARAAASPTNSLDIVTSPAGRNRS